MLLREAKKLIIKHKKDLIKLGVSALAVFGSVAKNEATPKSDVDILINFDERKGLFGLVDIKEYLEKLLGCKVDLLTREAIHPALKNRILQEAQHVF